jgi:hypothetical protein
VYIRAFGQNVRLGRHLINLSVSWKESHGVHAVIYVFEEGVEIFGFAYFYIFRSVFRLSLHIIRFQFCSLPRFSVFDSRMSRSNICESLWLLECGAVKGQLNNGNDHADSFAARTLCLRIGPFRTGNRPGAHVRSFDFANQ